ncbi:hypothetical protein IMCC3317_00370 [Kordia antarctica]|uniref:GmrSD restriction endonucleases N-terminal domain-containing protein n=1 Tax=Kordia antarctica TaxID=1218801 RepID=A0A7L4ZFG4_9FLAO|nr:DUF262 domain-containing protein [Kordia antarctica]QHI34694.1 hypothetical protein IMCC3317_00370 [Kordia antarctica]
MSLSNNIQANSRKLFELLRNKYIVDYFQREYKWGFKHIEQLLIDLESSFNTNYNTTDQISDVVGKYNSYYLGPIVICEKGNIRSIVDGQQRLTSITLLLIYLNNLQKESDDPEEIEGLIYSKKGGRKSYNIEVPDRTKVLDTLFKGGIYDTTNETDESIINMVERYSDIMNIFSDDLKKEKLPLFIEWVKEKIVFVEILAFTDENAYTIFETMNDRGLNLSPTEMLKGYLLTHVKELDKVDELNLLWKSKISNLHKYSTQEDLEFIRAWLRSQYADSIRSGSKGAENEDFEKIGTRFHTWVKDNHRKLKLTNPKSYYHFIKGDFEFYSSIYEKIKKFETNYTKGVERLYLSSYWNIASSLSYPLLMAPINKLDNENAILQKLNTVSSFIDILVVTRAINYKGNSQSFLRYIIYSLVKEIRNKNLNELREILKEKLYNTKENLNNLEKFVYTNGSRKFIHYLKARCILHVERAVYNNTDVNMNILMATRKKNRFVLAPIISNYQEYVNEFKNEDIFYITEKKLGNYLLIPNPIAIGFCSDNKSTKINKLSKEYLLTNSLTNIYHNKTEQDDYLKNLGFEAFTSFKETIDLRTLALNKLIRDIWDIEKI